MTNAIKRKAQESKKASMITKEELDKLLPQIEQDRLEKTISVKDANKFGEAICAFANDLPDHKQLMRTPWRRINVI